VIRPDSETAEKAAKRMQEQAFFRRSLKMAICFMRSDFSDVEWNGRHLRPFWWVLVISHFKLFVVCSRQTRLMELADTKRTGGPTIDGACSRFVDKVPF
jgi:hypothetical protein